MERLTFGYGLSSRHVDPALVRRAPSPPPEDQIRPIVMDPLPGESSDWAYLGLLAFTGLLFFRPQDQLPFLEPLHLAEVSALLALAAMAVKRLVRGLPLMHVTPELIGLFAFGAVLVVTTPFSYWPGGSIEVITGLYLKVLLIVVLMVNSLNTPLRLQRFTRIIVLASAYISFRAVFDYVRGVNLVENGRVAGSVQGIFGNPNDLALNMVTFLPMAAIVALLARRARTRRAAVPAPGTADPVSIARPFTAKRPRTETSGPFGPSVTPINRVIAGLAGGVMFLAIIFTKSRGGFLGLVAMLLVFLYDGRRLRPGIIGAALVLLLAVLPLLPSSFWLRMSSITDPTEDVTGSRAARREVMTEAFQVFIDRPLTGIGAGQFKNYNPSWRQERWREAHNVWLQVASETGVGGVLTFGFLVFGAFRAAFWSKRQLARYYAKGRRGPARGRIATAVGPGQAEAFGPPLRHDATQSTDLGILRLHATALVPSLVGWLVCAFFASVAYNWTFYYLLGLCVVTRELTRNALLARAAEPVPAKREPVGRPAVA